MKRIHVFVVSELDAAQNLGKRFCLLRVKLWRSRFSLPTCLPTCPLSILFRQTPLPLEASCRRPALEMQNLRIYPAARSMCAGLFGNSSAALSPASADVA